MIKRNQQILNGCNLLLDAILTILAFYGARFIRFELLHGVENSAINSRYFFTVAVLYSIIIVLLYFCFRLYRSQRFKELGSDFLLIFGLNAVCTLGMTAVLYLNRETEFSRVLIFLIWLTASLFVIFKHVAVKLVLERMREKGYNLKHVVLVGNGHLAHQCLEDIRNNPRFGLMVDGYVAAGESPELGKYLGHYEDLGKLLDGWDVDELLVALEPGEAPYMRYVIEAADKEGVRVNLIPFFNDYYPAHPIVENVGRTKLINLRVHPLDNVVNAAVKRMVDIVGSLVLIVLTSPLMLFAAIGVKLSSPGPILFRQERVGKGKKPFTMLKFRSMRTDIDHNGWSTDTDPRKTRFGSFIRKCSIDELPQLFNVLSGSMSLVGPRPELPFYVRQFKEEIPLYLVRQDVRPGITGWAQVHGLRGDTSIEKRVVYDIWYIENWSLWLDIRILFMTAFGGMINNEKL